MKFLVYILLLFLTLSVTGCSSKLSEDEFIENHNTLLNLANDVCISKGMSTVGINYKGFYDVKAICMTRSPVKLHEVEINLK